MPQPSDYDPGQERYDVAIRALYRLAKSGHWPLLAEVGLSKEEALEAFQDVPFPKSERDIFALVRRCPALVPAAVQLIARYQQLSAKERREHYIKEFVQP